MEYFGVVGIALGLYCFVMWLLVNHRRLCDTWSDKIGLLILGCAIFALGVFAGLGFVYISSASEQMRLIHFYFRTGPSLW